METERVAAAEGFRYVHSANEPQLIAGVGTMALEIFEDLANVDVIIAPAGGGSCASGNCIVAKHLNPKVRVIAVQSDAAPAMWHAWRNRNLDPWPTMKTEHEGLATRTPFELTNRVLWSLLDVLVLSSLLCWPFGAGLPVRCRGPRGGSPRVPTALLRSG